MDGAFLLMPGKRLHPCRAQALCGKLCRRKAAQRWRRSRPVRHARSQPSRRSAPPLRGHAFPQQ